MKRVICSCACILLLISCENHAITSEECKGLYFGYYFIKLAGDDQIINDGPAWTGVAIESSASINLYVDADLPSFPDTILNVQMAEISGSVTFDGVVGSDTFHGSIVPTYSVNHHVMYLHMNWEYQKADTVYYFSVRHYKM